MAGEQPIDVVRRFCETWRSGNPDAIADFFLEDATYQNMMDDPWQGRPRIREAIGSFFTVTPKIDFTIRNIASQGNVVLAERIDVCTTTAGVTAHLPLVGVFEIEDGSIAVWRDYYDNAQFRLMLQHPPRNEGRADDSDLGVVAPNEAVDSST
jgi:limonene-1,2-epoxide hydrolase